MKQKIYNIPFVGYILRLFSSLILLPRKLRRLEVAAHQAKIESVSLQEKTTASNLRLIELIEKLNADNEILIQYSEVISDLRHQIDYTESKQLVKAGNKQTKTGRSTTFADNHDLDDFYLQFENKFRGDESLIVDRLKIYLKYFKERNSSLTKLPTLDIGCGRGEFLELLSKQNIKVRGLDLNSAMVIKARDKGYDVVENDALSYLLEQKRDAFSAICGFHIVEHLPFPELMKIFNECYRTIKANGFVIFETPNPENLTVGSLTFNYDPSHLKPLPPQLLKFCLEYTGFKDVEIVPLHPEKDTANSDNDVNEALLRIFGPRDYAVIAKKPKTTSN